MHDGLLAAAIPFQRDPGPVLFSDGTEVVLVVAPVDAVADAKQSGLGAGHSLCRFVAMLLEWLDPS